jgi:microcystin-dependent protein
MGRTPLHRGQGPGLSPYNLGEVGGVETVTLVPTELPAHTHAVQGDTAGGGVDTPAAGALWSAVPRGHPAPYVAGYANATMAPQAIGPAGGSQPHNNRSPYLAVTFIIALVGIFPSRT